MDTSRIKVELLGTSFFIESSEDREYLNDVVAYLTAKVDEVQGEAPVADPVKITLIAGLNLVDELFKERAGGPRHGEVGRTGDAEIGRIAESLIERIDRSLRDE